MVRDTVDSVAGRFGVPAQAVAVLMIVFGLLIIVLPQLLHWLVGIFLITVGIVWLISASGSGWRMGPAQPREPASPPPRV